MSLRSRFLSAAIALQQISSQPNTLETPCNRQTLSCVLPKAMC